MKITYALIIAACFSLSAHAANVSVDFVKKEQYKDIHAGGTQSQPRFEEKLFKTLEKSFAKNAEKLPGDLSLKISVLDIDLAGAVAHGLGMGQDIRQISDKDFPRVLFYMILENKDGEIVFQGRQNLKEKRLRHGDFRMKGSQSDFFMETGLITKWFDTVLVPAVAKL